MIISINTDDAHQAAKIRGVAVRTAINVAAIHDHSPGVVAILDAFPSPSPADYVGKTATLRRPEGGTSRFAVGDARQMMHRSAGGSEA